MLLQKLSWLRFAAPAWLLLLTLVMLTTVPPANPWLWDLLNGFGLAALALLGVLVLAAPASAAGYSARALRLHIGFTWLLMLAVLVHALGLLLTNSVAVEYLKWRAPWYMHAGNLALVLLVVLGLTAVARVRRALHSSFHQFRKLHRLLSVVAFALCIWHVVGSGYLARFNWQWGAIVALAIGLTACWWALPRRPRWPGLEGQRRLLPYLMASAAVVLVGAGLYVLRLLL